MNNDKLSMVVTGEVMNALGFNEFAELRGHQYDGTMAPIMGGTPEFVGRLLNAAAYEWPKRGVRITIEPVDE